MKAHASPGFSLIELLIVVAVLCVLLFAFAPGALRRAKARSSRINCTNNLKQIGLSFKTFAIDNEDKYPFEVSQTNRGTMELVSGGQVWSHLSAMSNELSTPKILVCPEDKGRTVANYFGIPAGSPPPSLNYRIVPLTNDLHVSYFVNVDASEFTPQALLAGDWCIGTNASRLLPGLHSFQTNISLTWIKPWHDGAGNILLGDGSVQQVNPMRLQRMFSSSVVATNRLVVP